MLRIGFDIGGSKIAAVALDQGGRELGRRRQDVPRDYAATRDALARIARLVAQHRAGAPLAFDAVAHGDAHRVALGGEAELSAVAGGAAGRHGAAPWAFGEAFCFWLKRIRNLAGP